MMRHLLPLLFISATTGCLTSEAFVEQSFSETCDWYQRCSILEIIGYESPADCVGELTALAEETGELGESCVDYDRESAVDCLEDLQNAGCDDMDHYPESCLNACPAPE